MSLIDVGIAAALLWLTWQGFQNGLVRSLVWLLVVGLTPVLASHLTPLLAAWLATDFPDLPSFLKQPVAVMVSLTAAGALIGIVSLVLAGFIGKLMRAVPLVWRTNQVAGGVAGMATGVISLGMVTLLVAGFVSPEQQGRLNASVWGSAIVPRLAPLARYASALLPNGIVTPCGLLPEVVGASLAGTGTADTAQAAQSLLAALHALDGTALAGMPAGTVEAAQPLFDAMASGTGVQDLPVGTTQAATLLLQAMAGCSDAGGTESATAMPAGATDAALQILKALTAGGGP